MAAMTMDWTTERIDGSGRDVVVGVDPAVPGTERTVEFEWCPLSGFRTLHPSSSTRNATECATGEGLEDRDRNGLERKGFKP